MQLLHVPHDHYEANIITFTRQEVQPQYWPPNKSLTGRNYTVITEQRENRTNDGTDAGGFIQHEAWSNTEADSADEKQKPYKYIREIFCLSERQEWK